MDPLDHFREVWLVDTEYHAPPGERPTPICLCGRELFSGRELREWYDGKPILSTSPIDTGPDVLFVAYFASAELGVYLVNGWPVPARILDLYVEFRRMTSGLGAPCGHDLLGALAAFGLPCMDALAKEDMRALAIRGGPYTPRERRELLAYCQEDADALARLLQAMLPTLDLPRALLRGRYMAAVARMEALAVPMDTEALAILRANWEAVQDRLIEHIDADFGVYEGRHFCTGAFERYLVEQDIPWPRLLTVRKPKRGAMVARIRPSSFAGVLDPCGLPVTLARPVGVIRGRQRERGCTADST